MPQKPVTLATQTIAESRLFRLEQLQLRFSNGIERDYERVCSNYVHGAVLVIPVLDDTELLLVREYAAGIDQYVLGFPKGVIDDGETPLQTADRELQEEAGYSAQDLVELGDVNASPGYLSSKMSVVLAQSLSPKRLAGDEPEPLEVVSWPLTDIVQLCAEPAFCDARCYAALLMMEQYRGR